MATVRISDLWTPAVWMAAMREGLATHPSIINSAAVAHPASLVTAAAGPGVAINIPLWKDISDQVDEIQVEATAPANTLGITATTQIAVPLNRVTKSGVEALAAQVSGGDPVAEITAQLDIRRLKQRQTTLISMLRGIFGTAAGAALANAAVVNPNRLTIGDETGAAAAAAELISPDAFINVKTLLGENSDNLRGGAMFMHSAVRATLEKLDAASFKNGVQSGLPFSVETYRGVPIFLCDALVRAGTTSGFVYDTYFLTNGCIGLGDKPQVGGSLGNPVIDVASLNFTADTNTNSEYIFDRTRFIMHINGMKWVGTPAGQSATNAELATFTNWALAVTTANRLGIACLVSNG